MRHAARSRLGSVTTLERALGLVACLAGSTLGACELGDGDWERDQSSGATSSRGGGGGAAAGTKSTGGRPGSSGISGEPATSEGGESATGDVPASYPEPKIESMSPESGAYGTLVTITGEGLGSSQLKGVTLALGSQGEVELTPASRELVVSWSDEEIVFRYPFPAEGPAVLTTPKGTLVAGDFQPTWHVARELDKAPAKSVLASISGAAGQISLLFDTMPLTLLEVSAAGVTERAVTAPSLVPSSARLYLNAQAEIEGVGVSNAAEPVIVHLQNQAGDLVAQATTIALSASEFGVAGGSEGAAVWMRRSAGWFRARPSGATWAQDKGPIADADEDAPDRASGSTSDGSLFVAWSVDTGNFLDDMEAPYMAKLAPTATKFAAATRAGGNVDDYVTGLTLTSHGDGLVVRVCGSDVDPFGLSGTDRYCYDSLHAPSGAALLHVPVEAKSVTWAFTHERAVAAYCHSDRSWLIRSSTDVESAPGAPVGEVVAFPCPEAVALEVSGEGDYLPVIRWAGKTYLLERNPAAAPAE